MIKISLELIESLKFMLTQLEQNRLEVDLIDAPEPMHVEHKIRVKNSSNPVWYSELCVNNPGTWFKRTHKSSARGTAIRRKYIILLLNRLIKNNPIESKYNEQLLEIAQEMNDGTRPDYY